MSTKELCYDLLMWSFLFTQADMNKARIDEANQRANKLLQRSHFDRCEQAASISPSSTLQLMFTYKHLFILQAKYFSFRNVLSMPPVPLSLFRCYFINRTVHTLPQSGLHHQMRDICWTLSVILQYALVITVLIFCDILGELLF